MTLEELTLLLETKAAALRAAIVAMVEKRTLNNQANAEYLASQEAFALAKTDFEQALAQLVAL